MNTSSFDVIVVGAGIIGISTALKLQKEGKKVLVLDKKGVACETSAGNAGAFAFADVIPLATPGIMKKAPKWLFDPLGPLSIRPAYALKIVPWMWHFWRASQKRRYESALKAQKDLMMLSKDALERQIEEVGAEHLIRREGQLQLYEGDAEFQASIEGWNTRKEYGVVFELLESPEAIAKIQPGIDTRFTHAGFTPEWKNVVDPKVWTEYLAKHFVNLGGRIVTASVDYVKAGDHEVTVSTSTLTYRASHLVLAAGAWSKYLAKQLGDDVPLETERGYNTTLPAGSFDLKTHISFSNHGFVVTKVGDGVRVGGAVELGGLELAPNFKRADILLKKAAGFLPSLKTDNGVQWMGFRPSMPDSLPIISFSSTSQNVIYAFGHGHLGLTQSAGTAELVANMVFSQTTAISLDPYRVQRF
jgi:D-amino-acid dehydrogenase